MYFIKLGVGASHTESGRPEEFHLQSPTDPCVTVSCHTAPIIQPTIVGLAYSLGSSHYWLTK